MLRSQPVGASVLVNYQISSPVQIRADVITELPPIVGPIPALVYFHVVAIARWSQATAFLPTGTALEQGECLRTVRQIAEAVGISRSQADRAVQKLIELKLLEERPLGDTRILRVTSYLSVITLSQKKPDSGTLAGQERDATETLAGRYRDTTETITSISILDKNSTLKSTIHVEADASTDQQDSSKKRSNKRSPKPVKAKLVLTPPHEYHDVELPDWEAPCPNPLAVPVLPFTPPNQIAVGETLVPLRSGDVVPFPPKSIMPALEVYNAVFWVRPKEWHEFIMSNDCPDVDDFLGLDGWAKSNREKLHTEKRYSDHTTWLITTLRNAKKNRGSSNGTQRYGAT